MKRTVQMDAEDPKGGMTLAEVDAFIQQVKQVARDEPREPATVSASITMRGRVKWLKAEI